MIMPEWEQIGWRLRDIRHQRCYSAVELAQRSGLTKGNIYSAEHGKSVKLDTLVAIIQALDVSMDYIVLGIRPQVNAWGLILRSDDELKVVIQKLQEDEQKRLL